MTQALPTRRALLLGARAPDLAGVDHDLELMREALGRHAFADEHIEVVVPATRAGILAAMQRLIDVADQGDAIVVYYSGHGSKIDDAHVANAQDRVLGEATYYRLLVPSDIEQSTADDFRGYTNIELSLDLAALTRKTHNVIAIMDCCHAGRIFRADSGTAQDQLRWQDTSQHAATRHVELTGRWARHAASHYERLQATRQLELSRRDAEANPWAVRLLASASEHSAYEAECPPREGCSHRFAGAMTLALHDALMRVDARGMTWQDLGRLLRQTPQRGTKQRVTIEGPYRRFLFSLHERAPDGDLDVTLDRDRVLLAGGQLAGIAAGDRYELRRTSPKGLELVGQAEVTSVASSHAEVRTAVDLDRLGPGSSARPLRYGSPRAVVQLVGIDPGSTAYELLAARLEASGLVRVLGPDDSRHGLPCAGELRLERGKLQLWSGPIAFDVPHVFDPGRAPGASERLADHLAKAIRQLARVACLRNLPAPGERERLEPCWKLDWASVEGGRVGRPLAAHGEQLRVGELFTVRLTCACSLYFVILRARADGRIELLTRAQCGGVEVEPGQGYCLGQRSGSSQQLTGVAVDRPPRSVVKSGEPLSIALIMVLSDKPVDLRSWEQRGISRFVPRDALEPDSSLRNLAAPTPGIWAARYQLEVRSFDVN